MTFHLTAEQPSTSLSWSAASQKEKNNRFIPACEQAVELQAAQLFLAWLLRSRL